jgi:hypothetical protein
MQTSYAINLQPVGFPGQIVDIAEGRDVISVNASVALPYGKLAVRVSAASFDKIVAKLPTTALEITTVGSALGVVVADQARAQDPSVALATYPVNSAVPVIRKRRVWVVVEEAVVAGDDVYVRFAAGTGTELGAFRKSADTATAALLPGAKFVTDAALGGYAVLELNLA